MAGVFGGPAESSVAIAAEPAVLKGRRFGNLVLVTGVVPDGLARRLAEDNAAAARIARAIAERSRELAVAEERLDEDRRQLVRGDAGGEEEVEFFEGIVDRLVLRHTQAEGMGE